MDNHASISSTNKSSCIYITALSYNNYAHLISLYEMETCNIRTEKINTIYMSYKTRYVSFLFFYLTLKHRLHLVLKLGLYQLFLFA